MSCVSIVVVASAVDVFVNYPGKWKPWPLTWTGEQDPPLHRWLAKQAAAGAAHQETTGKDRFPATMSPRPELRHNHRLRKTFVNLQKGAGRREGLCIERIKMAPGLGSSRIPCLGGRTDRQTWGGLCLAVKDIFIPWTNSTVEQALETLPTTSKGLAV